LEVRRRIELDSYGLWLVSVAIHVVFFRSSPGQAAIGS